MEFFQNVWTWIVQNKDAILMTITSTNFISFITSIVLLVKTLKSTKDNTKSTNILNGNIKTIEDFSNKVNEIEIKVTNTENSLKDFEIKLNECIELQNLSISKLNLMLEAQTQVWSTIKDDNIRNSVNTILTSAKYKETSTIIDMKNKLEELKTDLAEKTEALSRYIKNAKSIKEQVTVTDVKTGTTKNTVQRV